MLPAKRRFPSGYYPLAGEFARFCGCCDHRATMVFRRKQLFVGACRSLLLSLSRNGRNELLARRSFLFGRRSRRYSACATVKADARFGFSGTVFKQVFDRPSPLV
jgi:hypothetical protein